MEIIDERPTLRPRSLDAVIEDARLVALRPYGVLSPDETDRLSRLAGQAARSLGATHAAVSFVGHAKVWFGGAFGFADAETSREHSFCDAVVRSNAPLLVPDGRADPRFWQHPMVCGAPGMRCYAGAPLVDPGGYTLGTVATYSTEPAAFGRGILNDLSALAGLVGEFLSAPRSASADVPSGPKVQGWLGVRTLQTDEGKRGRAAGLIVLSVAKGSPASLAGLRATDFLQSIDGQDLYIASDVVAAMAGRVLGSLVPIRYRRAGQWLKCQVEIVSRRT